MSDLIISRKDVTDVLDVAVFPVAVSRQYTVDIKAIAALCSPLVLLLAEVL